MNDCRAIRAARIVARTARSLVLSCAMIALGAATLHAQDPWSTQISATLNPVPIGGCGAVSIAIQDSTGRDAPRNPQGWRVSIADFDMSVQSVDPRSFVGKYNGPASFSVCACQAATVGASATITATYPSRALAAKSRVAGVAYSVSVPVAAAKAIGASEPQGCPARAAAVALAGSPAARMPGGIVAGAPIVGGTLVAPPLGTATAVAAGGSAGGAAASGGTAASGGAAASGGGRGAPAGAAAGAPAGAVAGAPSSGGGAAAGAAAGGATAPSGMGAAAGGAAGAAAGGAGAAAGAPASGGAAPAGGTGASAGGSAGGTLASPTGRATTPTSGSIITPTTASNPTGFVATQSDDQSVAIKWNAVPRASYYLLWGPGLPNTGVRVDSTTQLVSGVPLGQGSYTVGAFFLPGPVSTVATAFPTAAVNMVSACTKTPFTSGGPGPARVDTVRAAIHGATLTWTAVPGAYAYIVERQAMIPSNGPWILVGSSCAGARPGLITSRKTPSGALGPNSAGIRDDTGTVPDMTYTYQVKAIDGSGRMGWNTAHWRAPDPRLRIDSVGVNGSTFMLRAIAAAIAPATTPVPRYIQVKTSYGYDSGMRPWGPQVRPFVLTSVPATTFTVTVIALWATQLGPVVNMEQVSRAKPFTIAP